jgi:hypothetical protein
MKPGDAPLCLGGPRMKPGDAPLCLGSPRMKSGDAPLCLAGPRMKPMDASLGFVDASLGEGSQSVSTSTRAPSALSVATNFG